MGRPRAAFCVDALGLASQLPPAAPGGFDQVILKKVPCKKGIYVHGNRNLLEQGEDEKGKFYKVYYEEEE